MTISRGTCLKHSLISHIYCRNLTFYFFFRHYWINHTSFPGITIHVLQRKWPLAEEESYIRGSICKLICISRHKMQRKKNVYKNFFYHVHHISNSSISYVSIDSLHWLITDIQRILQNSIFWLIPSLIIRRKLQILLQQISMQCLIAQS